MKKTKFFVALSVIVIFCSFAAADWVNFQSAPGKFKMQFPRQPTPTTQKVDNETVPITIHMFVYDASKFKDDNEAYLAMYCDYPSNLVSSDFKDELVDTVLQGSINGMATNMKATVLSVEKVTYGEFPGRKVRMSVEDGKGFSYVKMFLVNNRMYMMEVLCSPDKDHNASIEKFFDSFSITDTKKPAEKKAAPAPKKK